MSWFHDWFHASRARLGLLSRGAAESRMDEEIRLHIELETARLGREEGLDPLEARRRALVAFGGVEKHKEELRDGRGLGWLTGISLDVKLAFRMLLKYPGLTLVGGVAMAFAIWVGAVTFEMVTMFVRPTLPLPNGDRIVRIQNWDVAASRSDPRALHDFLVWREGLRSVTELGAYRDVTRNLVARDGDARPVAVAEITASAFPIAAGRPLVGRVFTAADEQAGAAPVVVLGYDLWRTRFESDRGVVGQSVQLGDIYATVVGVMPDGFAFPVSHELWMPLRPSVLHQGPRSGPGITIFGRLAPGVTLEEAQVELTTLGRRAATEFPETHQQLQPRVGPYAQLSMQPAGEDLAIMFSIYVFAIMLLVLICGNVALLLFARAATRENELVVRSALGASRRRIVAQLFSEALVLGAVAAVVGLAAARLGLHLWGRGFLEANLGQVPFWYDPGLSPATVLYAVGLTVLGAVVAGVMPALKITRGLGSRLRQGSAGGGGPQIGGVWTAVIVAQVAVTVAFPAIAFVEQRELVRIRSYDAGFDAEEYLAVYLTMDEGAAPGVDEEAAAAAHRARLGTAVKTLYQRVVAEPGVAGVTFVDELPRTYHTERTVEVDDASGVRGQGGSSRSPAARLSFREVSIAWIDPSYFDVLGAPVLAGRAFHTADATPDARVAIVDRGFVDQVLGGRNPIGRRVRIMPGRNLLEPAAADTLPWYEIVGVVKELGMGHPAQRGRPAGLYLPIAPELGFPLHMLIHAQGDPRLLGQRLREIASDVDPALRLSNIQRADEVTDSILWVVGLWLRVTVVMTAIALLLSLAGIYAVLSFTVARRTREIGVRVALGASRRRVVAAIFRRPLTQVGLGVAAGGVLVTVAALVMAGHVPDGESIQLGGLSPRQIALLVAYVVFMFGVCLLACVVPTRRALRVEPTEALRSE